MTDRTRATRLAFCVLAGASAVTGGCALRSSTNAQPGALGTTEPIIVDTAVGYDTPEGVVVTQHLGPKKYSETAIAVIESNYPIQSISIDDRGSLRKFRVYGAPDTLEPNITHRFAAVQLDDRGVLLQTIPLDSNSQECVIVAHADTSVDPPVTTYSCDVEDSATPKTCNLVLRQLGGQWVYVCDCGVEP